MKKRVYLDYNATAPVLPAVCHVVSQIMAEPGNASAVHHFGRQARTHVERAREEVGALVGVQAQQITFTGGATESNNAVMHVFKDQTIWASAVEHRSVLKAAPEAEIIPVTEDGVIDEALFEKMLAEKEAPALISVMLVNNETGAIQPVEKLARLAKRYHPKVFFHTDAVQATGRIPVNFPALQVDYMSLSAHKLGGPQGVGAVVTAPGAPPAKLLYGGGQERRQRAGTENVAGIAGFGEAARSASDGREAFGNIARLRDRLEQELRSQTPDLYIFSEKVARVANTSNISLPGTAAQTMIMALDMEGIAVSTGSACSSGSLKASHVIQAITTDKAIAEGAFRISLGPQTTEEEIEAFSAAWSTITKRLEMKDISNA